MHASTLPPGLLLALDDGTQLELPADALERQQDGGLRLDLSEARLRELIGDRRVVIPVTREEIAVQTRVVETGGGVRVRKHVIERSQPVVLPVFREAVDVERVPVNQIVEQAPGVHNDGDTIVVPLCEEVLVVEKRLFLKEELRITRRRTRTEHVENVVLRSEDVTVERLDEPAPPASEAREMPAGGR